MAAGTIEAAPEVLAWARNVAGLSLEDAAKRLKVRPEELSEIEAGARAPQLGQLRRMASAYSLPLSTLLMPEPLELPERPEDMRTVGGRATRLSPATLRVIREVRERQELAGDLLAEAPGILPVAILPQAALSDPPELLAGAERARLGITVEAQLGWQDASEAFQRWRQAVEAQGIFVFVQPMPRTDARGFCLVDHAGPPVIVVNSGEADQAKSFTVFHEYAHLLLRSAALCLELQENVDRADTERFCNRFAAAFLMPEAAVRAVVGAETALTPADWPFDQLKESARKLKVSRPALALRLEELGIAPRGFFERTLRALESETWQTRRGGGGPGYAVAVVSQLGSTYSSLVLKALSSGIIDRNTASELLNAPARQFDNIASRVSAADTA